MTDIIPPAIAGWTGGKPDYNANPATAADERNGRMGLPGLYDVIVQTWPEVATGMSEGRTAVAMLPVQPKPPKDATYIERAWNDRAAAWIESNCGMQEAVDTRYGVAPLLAWAHDVVWHGWGVLVPRWLDGETPGWAGRVQLQPLVRSAVRRFRTRLNTLVFEGIEYQGQGTYQPIDYADCVHLTWGGQPGEAYGQGLLRSLVGPYQVFAGTISYVGKLQVSQAGRLIMTEGSPEQGDGAEEMTRGIRIGQEFDAGVLSWGILPNDWKADFHAAAGSTPDPTVACAWADSQAAKVFSARTGSVVAAVNGSRALGEVIAEEDHRTKIKLWDDVSGDAIGAVLGWLARETGYTGRIFRWTALPDAPTEHATPPEDVTAIVSALAQAVPAGLLTWSPEDEAELRRRMGWSIQQTPAPATLGHVHTSLCNHDPIELSEPQYTTRGRDGREVRHRMPPVAFLRDGVTTYPETSVAWLSDADELAAIERALEARVAPIVEMHRAALAGVSAPAEIARIRDEYTGAYYQAIRESAREARDVARAQAVEIAADQAATTPYTAPPDPQAAATLRAVEQARRTRADLAIATAAREMASRVEGEALDRPGMETRITLAGLLASAFGAIRAVASASRTVQALRTAEETGLVVAAWVRTSMMDAAVCGVCEQEHGKQWLFPEDEDAFVQYTDERGPPDPQCEGTAKKCRCDLVPVYARAE